MKAENANNPLTLSRTTIRVIVSVLIWLFLFSLPFYMLERDVSSNKISVPWVKVIISELLIVACMIVYYVNHLLLVPRLLLKDTRWTLFVCINVALVALVGYLLHVVVVTILVGNGATEPPEFSFLNPDVALENLPPKYYVNSPPPPGPHGMPPRTFLSVDTIFLLRDYLLLIVCVVVSVLVHYSIRWRESEHALRTTEINLLKHQINPHFLLNTLNNIHALIGIDPEQAQDAVLELGKMLRYLLYDTNEHFVSVEKEDSFLRNYIQLMKLRVSPTLNLMVDLRVNQSKTVRVAPMLAGVIVENAFKHGISGSPDDFIKIQAYNDGEYLVFDTVNSYYPNPSSKEEGFGIGLNTLQRRLELLYNGDYELFAKPSEDGKSFRAYYRVPKR